jgi:hypothetical protein
MQIFQKAILIPGILFLIFVVCPVEVLFASNSKTDQLINCDIQNQPCIQQIAGGSITFDIQPKPVKAMENLIFEIQIKDVNLSQAPVIDLSMPGMKMGANQVLMKMTSTGVYQGIGIIVRCPSGKTVWKARVNLPEIGSVDFIFDVIY